MGKNKVLIGALLLLVGGDLYGDDWYEPDKSVEGVRLEETVVTTTGFNSTTGSATKNITVVTREDIESKGAKDIGEALKGVPGVQIRRTYGEIQVDLRGQGESSNSNTLVLLDGVRLNAIDLSAPKLASIPIETIDRIEVVGGGGSILYGDGAVGGVINIITSEGEGKKGTNSLFMETGSSKRFRYGGSFGQWVTDKLLIQGSYTKNNYDGYRENGSNDNESVSIGGKYKVDDESSVTFRYSRYEQESGLPYYLSREEVDDDRTDSKTKDGRLDYKKDLYTLRYEKAFGSRGVFSLDTNYSNSEYDSYGHSVYGTDQRTSYDQDSFEVRPALKVNYLDYSNIIFGVDYYKGRSDTDYAFGSRVNRDLEKESKSVYLLNTLEGEKWKFSQGIRYEKTEYDLDSNGEISGYTGDELTYKDDNLYNYALDIGGSYKLTKGTTLFTSYTKGFRTPNTDELALADYDLEEQTHEYYELGVKSDFKNVYISGSVFRFESEDQIYYDPAANNFQGANSNLDGKIRKYGVEVFVEEYFDKFTFSQSFTYTESDIKDGPYEGSEVPGVSKYKGMISMKYEPIEDLIYNVWVNYYGDQYAISDFENEGEKVNKYITVDTNLSYTFKNGIKIYGGINNLFNEKYYDYVTYAPYYNSKDDKVYYPAPEREYYVGVKYTF